MASGVGINLGPARSNSFNRVTSSNRFNDLLIAGCETPISSAPLVVEPVRMTALKASMRLRFMSHYNIDA